MKKKLIIIIPILVAAITFIFVYRYYNKEDKTTTLTVSEKRWVEEHSDQTYDFEVVNDYPLYGLNGEGVIFRFLDDFEENVGLEFNRIPYLKESEPTTDSFRIRILDDDVKLSKKDLSLFNDSYVAIGKTYQRINSVKDFKNITFGVFEEDASDISYYLKSGTNLSYKNYDSIESLYSALDKDEVDMIIVPNIMYLSYTIEKDQYSINYFFTEMTKQIVLTLSDDNEKLNEIVTKYYNKWRQTNYVEEYNDAYLDYYLEANELDTKTKTELVSKTYTYGYVENPPYEEMVNGKVAGIAGEYVDRVARLSGITFRYKKYDTVADLKKAVDKGDVDIYFDYYNYNNDKYTSTLSTFIEKYVVLGREEDNHIVTSFESMKDKSIAMLGNDSLYNYFENNARAKIQTYDNIEDLVKESGSRLIVVDREIYTHYQNEEFKTYLGMICFMALLIAIALFFCDGYNIKEALTHAFYQVISITTSTGSASVDFAKWHFIPQALLFIVMFMGSCASSAGGGIKMMRWILVYKSMKNSLVKILHPNAILNVKIDNTIIPHEILNQTVVFVFFYFLCFALGAVLITILEQNITIGITSSITALGNIGPAFGNVVGPMGSFNSLHFSSKLIMIIAMLVGRLEIIPFLVLFQKDFWSIKFQQD